MEIAVFGVPLLFVVPGVLLRAVSGVSLLLAVLLSEVLMLLVEVVVWVPVLKRMLTDLMASVVSELPY